MAKVAKLATKWKASMIITAHGTPTPHHPKHPMHTTKKAQSLTNDRTSFSETWTLTVVKQTGPHLELMLESPRYKAFPVGTLSADGKFLQVVAEYLTWTLNIDGNTMSGTGTARNNHTNHYAAQCITMTVAK